MAPIANGDKTEVYRSNGCFYNFYGRKIARLNVNGSLGIDSIFG